MNHNQEQETPTPGPHPQGGHQQTKHRKQRQGQDAHNHPTSTLGQGGRDEQGNFGGLPASRRQFKPSSGGRPATSGGHKQESSRPQRLEPRGGPVSRKTLLPWLVGIVCQVTAMTTDQGHNPFPANPSGHVQATCAKRHMQT